MTLTAETLEKRLNNLAEEASRRGGQFDKTERTRRVEQLLTKLGKDMGYRVAVKGEGCDWGKSEWMNDVVWADLNEDELIRSIPLAAECEWGTKQDVWDDFQKLLVGRAKVRVMIFSANSWDKASSLVEELNRQIERFVSSQKGDRYLFASYVDGEKPPFSVEEYVVDKKILTIKCS